MAFRRDLIAKVAVRRHEVNSPGTLFQRARPGLSLGGIAVDPVSASVMIPCAAECTSLGDRAIRRNSRLAAGQKNRDTYAAAPSATSS
jgi:hypothetical protein